MLLTNHKLYDLIFNASGTYRIVQIDELTDTCVIIKQIWNPRKEAYENETTKGELLRLEELVKYATPNAASHEKEKERGKLKCRKLVMK